MERGIHSRVFVGNKAEMGFCTCMASKSGVSVQGTQGTQKRSRNLGSVITKEKTLVVSTQPQLKLIFE